MKRILMTALVCYSILGFAQYSLSEIPKDGYLKDFDIFVEIIQKQHPNPYRFHSKEEFTKKVDSLRKVIEKNPTYINFHLNTPAKILGDGHLSITTDSNYYGDFLQSILFFPIATYIHNGHAFVNGNNRYNIEIGSQILEINNLNINDIIKKAPLSSDGNIKVENIDLSLYISFICKNNSNTYTIKYKNLNGEEKTITTDGINYSQFYYENEHAVLPIDLITQSQGIYGYKINENTYYLSIKSFGYDESVFYETLKKNFQIIKDLKLKNLILDIRDNSGGIINNIPLLYSFISKEKQFTNSYRYATKVININYKDYLIEAQTNRFYSDQDIIDENNFMRQRFDKDTEGDYYSGNNRLDDTYIKNYPRDGLFFDGNVALIINNKTFSAATYFASLFKKEKRGFILGKETGSCSNFTTAAWFIYYRLPNTKSVISIPRSEVFFNENTKENITNCTGVIPDYTIDTNYFLKALKAQKDPEVEYALSLFK
ncbi:S41 family peptidase [Chryseobacterium oryctis]|uniref:S41 family peptidase n=1 Tax=Chryseobacterium oryctis TaxID=2952618 RepID=A0ABT3HK07_9FLAO|nr:S41 family peptidase [Chryseobacterium oryctis]MCW3160130.1 S41 family peptidase [Chryseobacterium oryctis]